MEHTNSSRRYVTHGETVLVLGDAAPLHYVVTDPLGIHARPAAALVKLAKSFPCTLTLRANGKSASLKSVFDIMSLNIRQGTEISVEAQGEGSAEALDAVRRFITEKL